MADSTDSVKLREIADRVNTWFGGLHRGDLADELHAFADRLDAGEGVPTPLRLYQAEEWPSDEVRPHLRRVGWLDQRGRVWTRIPERADRPADVGSFTPLLIELDD